MIVFDHQRQDDILIDLNGVNEKLDTTNSKLDDIKTNLDTTNNLLSNLEIKKVNHTSELIADNQTITGSGGAVTLTQQDMTGFSKCDYLLSLSLSAGYCIISVEASIDGTTWVEIPFSVNYDQNLVNSYTYISGDPNFIIRAMRNGKYLRVKITPDGTNDITAYVIATKLVI